MNGINNKFNPTTTGAPIDNIFTPPEAVFRVFVLIRKNNNNNEKDITPAIA